MKRVLSIDWLQLYCTSEAMTEHRDYKWLLMPYQTKTFKKLYEVTYKNELLCTVQCVPTSPIIPRDTFIVKFSNRELYGQNLKALVHGFLDDANLMYKSITRIDLAIDFNYFNYSLYPEDFIKRFLSAKYLKNGRGKFTLIGEQKFENSYQYLRFGERGADVNVYLYNKSVELAQVHDKPHIRKRWEEAELDTTKPIWRLEISIKSKGTHYVEIATGEQKRIDIKWLDYLSYLYDIFFSYAAQYFSFKKNDGTKNKTRMLDVDLIHYQDQLFKPLYLPAVTGSNMTDKIFAKKLFLLDQELRGLDDSAQNSINHVLTEFLQATNLNEYYEKKSPEWKREYFRE